MKVSQSAVTMERKHRRDMAKKYPQDEQKQTKPRGQTPIQKGEPRRHSRAKQASFLAPPPPLLHSFSFDPSIHGSREERTQERGGETPPSVRLSPRIPTVAPQPLPCSVLCYTSYNQPPPPLAAFLAPRTSVHTFREGEGRRAIEEGTKGIKEELSARPPLPPFSLLLRLCALSLSSFILPPTVCLRFRDRRRKSQGDFGERGGG